MRTMKSAHLRGALAVTGLAGVVAAIACSSMAGTSSPGACANGSRSFSRSRLQVADLSDFICENPAATTQARTQAKTSRIIEALGSHPNFQPELTAPSWSYPTTNTAGAPPEPVTGTPALWIPSYPTTGPTDTLFFGAHSSTGPQLLAVNNLYTTPVSSWAASLTGSGMDGSWIETDGSSPPQVYVEDTTGTLWCFTAAAGATCAGWTHQKYPATGSTNGSQYTSPWWSYDQSALYYADSAGYLTKVSQATGRLVWTINLGTIVTPTNSSGVATSCPGGCNAFQVRGSPIEYNGHIYIGNDGGAYFNITDPGSATPTASNVQATWLCGSPTSVDGCNSTSQTEWSVLNASSIDVSKGVLYTAVAGSVYEFTISSSTWLPDDSVTFFGGATLPVYSSPILDRTNGNIYVGYNNSLYKITYPLTGSFSSVALQGQGANASYPHSSPLPYSGNVVIGDGAGEVENYGCMTQANPQAPQLTGVTASYGTTIDSSPIADFVESGINFGYTNGSGGGAAQTSYSAINICPGGGTCTNGCGGAGATICTHGGGCCSSSDCPTAPTNGSYSCTANACVESCNSGYKICNAQCISNASCCTNADCAAPDTCSPTTGLCIAPVDNVTLNLNYPANGTITSVTGSVIPPVTQITADGTISVTNGSTTVTGTGTTFTTTYATSMGAIVLATAGSGYTSVPTFTWGSGCTTNPAATATLSGQFVVAITAGGTAYTSAPTVTFTGGGCSTEPTGTATLSGVSVGSVTVATPGVGCTTAPTVGFSGGAGHGATAKASTSVATVTLTSGGTGCTSAPTVTFTGGGAGAVEATATVATGLSFSIDGATWYEIASVASATSLTLATNYLGTTEAGLSTYYESDCNAAAQNCNQTYPFTISNLTGTPSCTGASVETCPSGTPSCNSVTCSTSVVLGLSAGAFSFSALGYDSSSRKEASAILPNKLNVTGPSTTTAYLNMIRSFPIGTGNATCPLNLAEDSNGNIWTVNSNGENSASTCAGPTNNLSELVKSASPPYAPTVIPNTVWGVGGTAGANPEFIVGDSTGNVWFTTPGTNNGVFEIAPSSSLTTPRTQYTPVGASCVVPRGLDVDPNTSPNGVFVACAGTSASPEGSRFIIRMDGNGNESNYYDFTDYTAQPVSLVYARSYTPGSGEIINTDYHGNFEVYVNRSGTSQNLISALEWNPNTLAFYDPCNAGSANDNSFTVASSDGNLYGLSYDSGGTPYAASVASGEVLNVELNAGPIIDGVQVGCGTGTMNQDSNNNVASPSPWGTANDDLWTYGPRAINGNTLVLAGTDFYASHYTSNTVTRFADGEGKLNDYIVGATATPGPAGLLFDRTQGVVWVADSKEASLTQINKNLMLFVNQSNTNAWGATGSNVGAACTGLNNIAAGTNVNITGYGFDTSLSNGSNNTVLLAGYMAPTVSVTSGNADGVGLLEVSSGGSGYTSAPTVTLSGGGCTTEPTATATISGTVTVTVVSGGSNYTSAPTVTFGGGGATAEATAVANLSGSQVTGITFTTGGANYTATPTIAITGGGCTTEPTATAAITANSASVTVTSGGVGYTSPPTVTLSGGGCTTEPTATATITPGTTTVTVSTGGVGYTGVPTLTFSGCTTEPTATATVTGGVVTGVTVNTNGSGCGATPGVTFSGGGATTQATGTVTFANGTVTAIAVNVDGSGCSSDPVVGFSGGGDTTDATATANLSGGVVTSVALVTDGVGCTSNPIVAFSGGGGAPQATAAVTISGGSATGIALTTGGAGYTGVPSVTFAGGGATTQATATASLSGQEVIAITTPGVGYTSDPTITFTGGCTTEPVATSIIAGGQVTGITVTTPGSGCTTAPTVVFTGGGFTTKAVAKASTSVAGITMTSAGGVGYTSAPIVNFTGGCAIEPLATATISGGKVTAVNVTTPGGVCTAAPTVSLAGGGFTQAAAAEATISGSVTGGGSGTVGANDNCSSVPSVSISGGGGSGASASLQWVDPLPTTLVVTVPSAPHGVTGPVIVANQGGQVESYCTFTTK